MAEKKNRLKKLLEILKKREQTDAIKERIARVQAQMEEL